MIMTETLLGWHFVGDSLRDGRPIPDDGVPLVHEGEITICKSGLHASERIIDALPYAPGNTICRVQCAGVAERDNDKFVCRKRTILWRVEGAPLFRAFARRVALDVIHLWDAPEIVRRYLETGDQEIREAAWDAAGKAVARSAAWTVWSAATSAATGTARTAGFAKYNDWLTEMVEGAKCIAEIKN